MNIKRLFILTGTVLLGLALVSMWMLFLSAPVETARAAGPWYVAPGGSDGDSCLSTTAPCATINGAIGKATGGDTIFVATGTYTGTGDEVVLIDKDITLSGGWDVSFTSQTDISSIDGENTHRGVNIAEGITTIINNFHIQNGSVISPEFDGGGIYIQNTSILTLTNSIVSNNMADTGGGIYVGNSKLFLESSVVSGNTASYGEGGGFKLGDGHLVMSRSWVVGNAALNNDAGGISFGGDDGSAHIENSIIAGNTSADSAGGLQFGPGGPYRIVNSHIVGNHTFGEGAAIATYEPVQVALTNTLVISNTGITGIDDKNSSGSVFFLNYCDTYGNSPDGSSGVTINRTSCLATQPEVGLNPMMAGGALPSGVGPDYADEWLNYDYRLLPGSPAIDAGTPVDAPPTDIEGNPRDANPDLGAYEMGNSPPSISGAQAGQHVDDKSTIDLFTGVTISDPDDDTLTVKVSLDNANKGELTSLGGFVEGPSGTYTFVGSPASATTAIQGLTFNPTENRKTPGSTDTTTFTIIADDGIADPVTDNTTTVIATSINDPPTIEGTVAGQTVNDDSTIDPFTGVTITDPDKNASLTVVVSLDDPTKGILTNLGGFIPWFAGTYKFTGTPTEATTAIQVMTFVPTKNRVPVGDTDTTTFTISADDGIISLPVTDDTTTVIVTSINDPPSINGTEAGQTVDDNATIDPFSAVTIVDLDNSDTLTVTVTLDNADKGSLINLGGFVEGPAGTYTFMGSPVASTTAIRGLTFVPTEGRVPVDDTETTTFTISANDSFAAPVTDDTTTVIVTAVGGTKKIFLPLVMK